MTIGTAMVARTSVRRTVDMLASRSPSVRFSAVSVGKTHSQIIRASWWRVGGGTADGSGMSGHLEGAVEVVGDEVRVDRDGDGGAFARGGDDLGGRVGGVPCRPDAGEARAAGGGDADETIPAKL